MLAGLLGPAGAWPIEESFLGLLGLSALALPWLWCASGDQVPARTRWAELLVLISATLPPLSLSGAFAAVPLPGARAALVYLSALWLTLACLLAWGPRCGRILRGACCLAWVGAFPLLFLVGGEVGLPTPAWLEQAAPVHALLALLGGGSLGTPLLVLAGLCALGLLPRLRSWRGAGRARLAGAVALGLGCFLGLQVVAQPKVRAVRPLLGGHLRAGEPYPLRVELENASAGDELAATSFGQRYATRVAGDRGELIATPVGGGYRLELEARAAGAPWTPQPVELPPPRLLGQRELLVGSVGAAPLVRALCGERPVEQVELERSDLGLSARAGEALDLVLAGRGAAHEPPDAAALRAWTAAGGVLVCEERADLLAVAGTPGLAARGRVARGWDLRPLGGGLLAGPAGAEPLLSAGGPDRELLRRLLARPQQRARRLAIQDAVLLDDPPRVPRALERRAGLAALAGALALVLLSFLRGRLRPATFLGGAALAGPLLALLLRALAAPAGSVHCASVQVLELPAGARVARRLELLRCAAPRLGPAVLRLRGWAPPRPVFASGAEAIRCEGSVFLGPDGAPELRFPVGPQPRTFARLDACTLAGTVRLTRGSGGQRIRIINAGEELIRQAFAVTPRGFYRVGQLAPGASHEIDRARPPVPFARWRLGGDSPDERRWRRLVTAALSGRDLQASLLLVGKLAAPARVAAGAASEQAHQALLVVVASHETQ